MSLPVAYIRNNWLRRAAMLVAFPALIVWFFNWRLPVLALMIIANAVIAARDSVIDDIRAPGLMLLAAAWRKMWRAPC